MGTGGSSVIMIRRMITNHHYNVDEEDDLHLFDEDDDEDDCHYVFEDGGSGDGKDNATPTSKPRSPTELCSMMIMRMVTTVIGVCKKSMKSGALPIFLGFHVKDQLNETCLGGVAL